MLTFEKFTGINNVQPSHRLQPSELTSAVNVDIGLSAEVSRRAGYTEVLDTCHKNLWQAKGFMLATVDGGNLIAMDADGANRVLLLESLGVSRVWYCNLPDGRTTFTNGLISGITDGVAVTGWGVPMPASLGAAQDVAGDLFPGTYQYQVTHVRLSDGLEGAPLFSGAVELASGGILITGLPIEDGYKTNVYLSSHNGDVAYLAGSTFTSSFAYLGANDALVLPCHTEHTSDAPPCTVTAFWRGRVLVASDNVLYATRPNGWEVFDFRRDFKQFSAPITLIQPVSDGVYVGTTEELAFLSGTSFDALSYRRVVAGTVALGSGVTVDGSMVQFGQGAGQDTAMICIADGVITAGFGGGSVSSISDSRYKTDDTEFSATFRMNGRIPQYIAVPQ